MSKGLFEKINSIFLDTLFPVHCLNCQKENQKEKEWICQNCLEKISILENQVCPYCEKVSTEKGAICCACKNRFPGADFLDGLIAAAKYKENNLNKAVHFFKYNFIADMSVPLGKILVKSLWKNNSDLPDIILPVPLHPRRMRWRGFNQSFLLADFVSQNLTPGMKIPTEENILLRKKYTAPQMKVKDYFERQKNIQKAFAIDQKNIPLISGKKILLIDDVATTGSTIFECAKVLKKNGAKKVFAVVIARQEIHR